MYKSDLKYVGKMKPGTGRCFESLRHHTMKQKRHYKKVLRRLRRRLEKKESRLW